MKESFRPRHILKIPVRLLGVVGVTALVAAGCSTDTSVSETPPNSAQRQFARRANTTIVHPGEVKPVERVISELESLYESLPEVDQRGNFGADINNPLSSKPYRYETNFKEGDGTGADTVCEDLRVPDNIKVKYVRAVTDSEEEAWVALDEDKDEAHICYDEDDHPDTVVVWGDYRPR